MRSLLRYLVNNYAFLLFFVLEVTAFVFIFNSNNYQKVTFFNSSNRLTASVYGSFNSIVNYFELADINRQLSEENASLRSLLSSNPQIAFNGDSLTDNAVRYDSMYQFISARVINNSVNKQNNYITLNKGRKDGVKPDMGIVSARGLVGVVTNVSESYSAALPVLNSRWNVSAKIKSNGFFGRLSWNGADYRYANLLEIPFHIELSHGDTIVTSGYSSIFPEGIIIGTIQSFSQPAGENYYDISILLSTNFKTLSFVEIVNHLDKPEITALEKRTEDGATSN